MPSTRPLLLVLASTYPRWSGDAEPGFVHELAKRLTGQFRVMALVPHAPGAAVREALDGVEIVRYRYAPQAWETLVNNGGIITNLKRAPWKWLLVPSFMLMQLWYAWRLLRTAPVAVIHAHWFIPQGCIAALLRTLTASAPPFLVTAHGADAYALQRWPLSWVKRWVARRAAAITVVSSAMLEQLQRRIGSLPAATVLPMGVDVQQRFTPDPAVIRAQHELLFVGRLVEKKGLPYLLAAMPLILQRFPDAQLNIVGFGVDEAQLRAQVAQLQLGTAVQFLGAVQQAQLPALYRHAALFTAPFIQARSGDQEGLPVALMEAIACACPVVVGDIPGIGDLLGSWQAQVCVDAQNVPALAAAIIAMLEQPQRAQMLAQQLRQSAVHYVDWQRIATEYGRILANISST